VQVIAWRTVSEMTYNVSSGMLNLSHLLTHSHIAFTGPNHFDCALSLSLSLSVCLSVCLSVPGEVMFCFCLCLFIGWLTWLSPEFVGGFS